MKTYEREKNMNAKKINMEMITWVFFERVCLSVCACTVYYVYVCVCEICPGDCIMVGLWPL